jgi:hypothetical protein
MKPLFSFLVLTLQICFLSFNSFGQEIVDPTPTIIVISDPIGQGPRTPNIVPISGYVYENTIYLFFSNDLGDVNVRIEDSFGCTILSTTVDSSDGSESIPFSGAPGIYTIYFTLEDNTSYIGRFEVL